MSLYHHVAGMDDLLDAVADLLLAEVELPSPATGDLASTLSPLARAYLAVAASHPRAFRLLAARRLRSAAAAGLLAQVVALLAAHDLDEGAALRTLRVFTAYLNGAGLALAAWRLDADAGGVARGRRSVAAVRADLEAGVELLVAALAGAATTPAE
jgi:AcrR family transcriptional regulator